VFVHMRSRAGHLRNMALMVGPLQIGFYVMFLIIYDSYGVVTHSLELREWPLIH
jgi:hypothetical protein